MLDDLEQESIAIANNKEVFSKKFSATIEQLIELDITPIVVQNAPGNYRDPSRCNQVNELALSNKRNCDQTADYIIQKNAPVNELFTQLDKSYKDLKFIPVHNLLCDNTFCSTTIDSKPFYYDDDHASQAGAMLLGKKYMENATKILQEHVNNFYLD
jgi:lysophospholipase L1-like esterase